MGPGDQRLGLGDGTTRVFPLAKTYGTGPLPYRRLIAKPVAETVRVAVAGVERAPSAFTCDAATGLVTLATAPAAGAPVAGAPSKPAGGQPR